MKPSVAILLTCLLASTFSQRVVFRLDDIQDFWLVDAQQAVINVFKNRNLPMTIGIISNYFGEDSSIVNYVKGCIEDSSFPVEIANHGWNHEDFPSFTLSQQQTLLSESKTKTISDLNNLISDITTFIPPFDDFNDNTVTALANAGYTAMSSDTSFYGCNDNADCNYNGARPYPVLNNPVKEFPAGSGTNDLYDENTISVSASFQYIQEQIAHAGFSVVMMHFNWYADDNGNVIQSMITQLEQLVADCQNAGYSFGTVGGLTSYLEGSSSGSSGSSGSGSSGSGSASSTTHKPPKSLTTHKAASAHVTTGKATPVTTGKSSSSSSSTPPPPPSSSSNPPPPPPSSTSCTNEGYMQCASSETFQKCAYNAQGQLAWGPNQSCGSGTTCHPSGDYIYCY